MIKTVYKTGEIIRKERKALSYSQEELAEMLGTSRVTISKWETGRDHIHDDYFFTKMSEIFDCDEAYLKGTQTEKHRAETDIKAVTGLTAETIQALSELCKQTSNNTMLSALAQKRLSTINVLLISILSDPRKSILDNMYNLISTLSQIREIESSEIYKMSEAEILQAQLDDPDNAEALSDRIKAYERDLIDLKKNYKIYKTDLTERIEKDIDKIELR